MPKQSKERFMRPNVATYTIGRGGMEGGSIQGGMGGGGNDGRCPFGDTLHNSAVAKQDYTNVYAVDAQACVHVHVYYTS